MKTEHYREIEFNLYELVKEKIGYEGHISSLCIRDTSFKNYEVLIIINRGETIYRISNKELANYLGLPRPSEIKNIRIINTLKQILLFDNPKYTNFIIKLKEEEEEE